MTAVVDSFYERLDELLTKTCEWNPLADRMICSGPGSWAPYCLPDELRSIDDVSPTWRVEKVARIGFPLHLRLLRDLLPPGRKLTWGNDGEAIASAWGLPDHAGCAWFWHRMFCPESIRVVETVSTRTIAVIPAGPGEPPDGMVGVLTVGLIEWPENVRPPASGYVPHPESFGFCLDNEFVRALANSHMYLAEKLRLWPHRAVIEWTLKMEDPNCVPILAGGSAGAAMTLASGSLLAKRLGLEHAAS